MNSKEYSLPPGDFVLLESTDTSAQRLGVMETVLRFADSSRGVGVLCMAAANLFLFDVGIWNFRVQLPTNAVNQQAALSRPETDLLCPPLADDESTRRNDKMDESWSPFLASMLFFLVFLVVSLSFLSPILPFFPISSSCCFELGVVLFPACALYLSFVG